MNEFRDRGAGDDLPPGLSGRPWAPPNNFLGLPPGEATFASSPGHTLPELVLSGSGPEAALDELRQVVDGLLDAGKFVILLGGEHSVSAAPILAHADRADGELSVLQLDAHADLRAEYEGTPFSHACVMHRVHDRARLVPVGIRSLTSAERSLMRELAIPAIFGYELVGDEWIDGALDSLGDTVFVTIDVDYFDRCSCSSASSVRSGWSGAMWWSSPRFRGRLPLTFWPLSLSTS